MDTLVTTKWLSRRLDDPDLVVLDCSVITNFKKDGSYKNVSGRASYEKEHILGASFADLTDNLRDKKSPLEFALPSPEKFCKIMGDLGVGDDSRVVLYDDSMSGWAARIWWMLRWVGFDRAALLDGGFKAWKEEGQPLSKKTVKRPAKQLTLSLRPEVIADRNEVFAAMDDPEVSVIDTLPESFFRGEQTIYRRPGHIPCATNVSVMELTDESGRYKPLEKLSALFTQDRNQRMITYCGGGIAASSAAFVLTRLGYANVAVYIGSLEEWAADLANPMSVEHFE